jgi:hypothetical protein
MSSPKLPLLFRSAISQQMGLLAVYLNEHRNERLYRVTNSVGGPIETM